MGDGGRWAVDANHVITFDGVPTAFARSAQDARYLVACANTFERGAARLAAAGGVRVVSGDQLDAERRGEVSGRCRHLYNHYRSSEDRAIMCGDCHAVIRLDN